MRTVDFSPLFRTGIGFDRLSRLLDETVADSASGYPPYNIEKLDEDAWSVTLAVAGFTEDELDIVLHDGRLTIEGNPATTDAEGREFLHRGIAGRAFRRVFQLADHIEVSAARLDHGLLTVELKRLVPEELKPRKISITDGASVSQLDKAA
ncbi:MAG: Hsp20 family protein [Alphaproteobacteria bacterium]